MKKSEAQRLKSKKQFYEWGEKTGARKVFLDYVWNEVFGKSFGYSFSQPHSLNYSIIAIQELNLVHYYPEIYWNCACLTVESNSDNETDNNTNKNTNYGKMVRAIYNMINYGIQINPPSINKSNIAFTPDEYNNVILFGLGGISGINNEIAQEIISLRPYKSFDEFLYKIMNKDTTLLKPAKIIKLIKAGCFDDFDDRKILMEKYIHTLVPHKDELTIQNFKSFKELMGDDILKISKSLLAAYFLRQHTICKEQFYKQDGKFKTKKHYIVPAPYDQFVIEGTYNLKEGKDWYFNENDEVVVIDKYLDKALKPDLDKLRKAINQKEIIDSYNNAMIQLEYQKRVKTNDVNKWSFEATSFYHHKEHELKGVDYDEYNLSKYTDLPEEPTFIEKHWGKRTWHQYDLAKICGTVVDRNDNKHLIYLLTPELEVVTVKFYGGQYAYYKRIISDDSGVIDPSWFSRGELLMVSGYRQEDIFKAKRYSNSLFQHAVTRIIKINSDKSLELQLEKKQIEGE